jgi:hypothetical protein
MRSFTVLATIALAATSVAAIDLRQLYKHADSDSKAFCKAWNCAWSVFNMFHKLYELSTLTCFNHSINYEPASDTQYFRGSTCRPGDYRGLNIRTQALASCSFTEDGTTPIVVSDVVASQVGASLA